MTERKYDCLAVKLPDEPYFVLLARDLFAPTLIRTWAANRKARTAVSVDAIEADREQAAEAYGIADQMEVWRKANDGKWRTVEPPTVKYPKKSPAEPLHYKAAREAHELAGKLVQGDRRATHGDFIANFQAIAALWNGYIEAKFPAHVGVRFTAVDVAVLMDLMKTGRTLNGGHNPDDYVDKIGYSMIFAGLAEVEQQEKVDRGEGGP